MKNAMNRRQFLEFSARAAAVAAGLSLASRPARGDAPPRAAEHTLTVISGKPRERGLEYGRKFRDPIRAFLEKEIRRPFAPEAPARDDTLRYAERCLKEIRAYSPLVADELEGMAEGAGLRVEEAVLITLHEELWHKGVLPAAPHCTAIAAGPPETTDGSTYVGQTWDWMQSVYGLSSMLLWKRSEGPSLLAYAYPGLWVGAGMNSAGIALCWTSAQDLGIKGPRVGIPSYVLIAQMLYQDSLRGAIDEARRARHAGWFTFVLADGEGGLANVEGSPRGLVVEESKGRLARVYYGTREMTGAAEGKPLRLHPRCQSMYTLLEGSKGKLDLKTLQRFLGDHGAPGRDGICQHDGTLDGMVFDTTRREAHLTRGPVCSGKWKTFGFDAK